MRQMKRKYILFSLLAVMSGCSVTDISPVREDVGARHLKLNVAGMQGDASADSRIGDLAVYRFGNGVLEDIVIPQPAGEGGIYDFEAVKGPGEMYLLANASALGPVRALVPGQSTLEEYLSMKASADEMTSGGFLMTGRLSYDDFGSQDVTVRMTRSVARLDIVSMDKDVRVLGVKVTGLAAEGPVNPAETDEGTVLEDSGSRADGTDGDGFSMDFSDNPLQNGRETLLYMVSMENASAVAEVTAEYGGGLHRIRAGLPSSIHRNKVYTLTVQGGGAGISVSVSSGDDWVDGGVSGSGPSLRGLVDVENSVLPDGVRVNPSGDTVFVSYLGREFTLSLLAEPSSEVEVQGSVRGVEVRTGQPSVKSLTQVASVNVTSSLRMPGSLAERIYIDVRQGDVSSGRVVLVFEASPVEIDGVLAFDEDGTCDFGRYLDGELAVLSVPADREVSLEFPDGEDHWMKLVAAADAKAADGISSGKKVYRLLGGWKPNDPKADGREQSGLMVISSADGSDREAYTVKRLNWGLPVVKIGQTWWCRYNLRGNVKSFADQITCDKDPASQGELYGRLQDMPEDELLALMGDQYQAGNPDGLPLRHDGSAFYYEGMTGSAQNFGLLDPSVMAPDGYLVPDYGDYAIFARSDNYNLGGTGERTFTNRDGLELAVRIAERKVSFLGHEYGTVAFYDFADGDSHWTLFGLGHQWSTTHGNISRMNILLATYGNSGRTWVMEGYASTEKPGENWIKFADNNSVKTRTIRCVKAPVEYIYQ